MTGPSPRVVRMVAPFLVTLFASACVTIGPPQVEPSTTKPRGPEIIVGSFNFTESAVLAEIYGQALRSSGLPVKIIDEGGPREILAPALDQGVVDLVAEYQGAALSFASFGKATRAFTPAATHRRLSRALEERELMVLDYAPAENQNEVVVTKAVAAAFDLRKISDLRSFAKGMLFGGPPECPERPQCLEGLRARYDLQFDGFQPLDAGGPLTTSALQGSEVDVAVMFTTDPDISTEDFVILRDDRHLQPSENIVPVLRSDVVVRYGGQVVRTLNAVSASLETADLRALNERVEHMGVSPAEAARDWLQMNDVETDGATS